VTGSQPGSAQHGDLLDNELRATVECRLVTTGRRSGEPREVRAWFAGGGDVPYLREALPVRIDLEREASTDP
jgi:hypothetical protein